jgi:hypothetical protein
MELLRMIFDEDEKETLSFLQEHFKDKARAVLEGEGHCELSFEMRGQ